MSAIWAGVRVFLGCLLGGGALFLILDRVYPAAGAFGADAPAGIVISVGLMMPLALIAGAVAGVIAARRRRAG